MDRADQRGPGLVVEAYDDGCVGQVTTELGLTTPGKRRVGGQIRVSGGSVEGQYTLIGGSGSVNVGGSWSEKSSEISRGHRNIRVPCALRSHNAVAVICGCFVCIKAVYYRTELN